MSQGRMKKTLKNILFVFWGLVIILFVGYLIYTGKQL